VKNKFVLVVLLVLGMVAMATHEASASLVSIVNYSFDGSTKDASITVANITSSIFDSQDTSVTWEQGNPSTGQAIADIGWKSGNYFYFSVTPAEGYELNIAGLQFDDNKDASLGTTWQVTYLLGSTESSAGTGSIHQGWSSTPMNTIDLSTIPALQNITDIVTFRIAALGGSNDNKIWRLDNVTLTGEVIPEPATVCLLGLGGLLLRMKRVV